MKKLIKLFTFKLFVSFFGSIALAAQQIVVFQTPGLSKQEYNAHILASQNRISYTDYAHSNMISSRDHNELKRLYFLSQDKFLNSALPEARNHFEKIVSQIYRINWNQADKIIIVNSLFKLAQISESAVESDQYLTQAINFYPNFKPDSNIYPPPLINRFESLHKSTISHQVDISALDKFDELYVDGEKYDLENAQSISIKGLTHRFHLVSNTYQDVIHIGNILDLYGKAKWSEPKVSGSCTQYTVSGFEKLEHEAIFTACAKSDVTNKSKIPNVDTKADNSLFQELNKSDEERFYQKSGFWMGTALLVGTAIYFANQKNDNSSTPTRKTGW